MEGRLRLLAILVLGLGIFWFRVSSVEEFRFRRFSSFHNIGNLNIDPKML